MGFSQMKPATQSVNECTVYMVGSLSNYIMRRHRTTKPACCALAVILCAKRRAKRQIRALMWFSGGNPQRNRSRSNNNDEPQTVCRRITSPSTVREGEGKAVKSGSKESAKPSMDENYQANAWTKKTTIIRREYKSLYKWLCVCLRFVFYMIKF